MRDWKASVSGYHFCNEKRDHSKTLAQFLALGTVRRMRNETRWRRQSASWRICSFRPRHHVRHSFTCFHKGSVRHKSIKIAPNAVVRKSALGASLVATVLRFRFGEKRDQPANLLVHQLKEVLIVGSKLAVLLQYKRSGYRMYDRYDRILLDVDVKSTIFSLNCR